MVSCLKGRTKDCWVATIMSISNVCIYGFDRSGYSIYGCTVRPSGFNTHERFDQLQRTFF
jgi:hypothetical protein